MSPKSACPLENEMESILTDFFKEEQKRIFKPNSHFCERVMRHVGHQDQREGLWEGLLIAIRPVFAVAVTLILALVSIEMFLPDEPTRDMVEAYIDAEITAAENLLYLEPQTPSATEVLEQLVVLGGNGQ
jgi:hypothetical protein